MSEAPWRRRAVLAGCLLGVTAWVIGAPRLAGLWPSRLAFRDLPGLSPFRELETAGALSTSARLLVGMDGAAPTDAAQDTRIAAVRADPCAALFGTQTDCRVVPNYGSLRVGRYFSKFVDLNYGSQARPALRIALCLQMKRLATCDRLCCPLRPTNAALCCRL